VLYIDKYPIAVLVVILPDVKFCNAWYPTAIGPSLTLLLLPTKILFKLVAVAAPSDGVEKLGEFENTNDPEPVSLLMTPASSELVVAANALNLLLVEASVAVPAGIVTVPLAAADVTTLVVPLVLPASVKPPLPIEGVVKDGDVDRTTLPVPVEVVTPVPPLATGKIFVVAFII